MNNRTLDWQILRYCGYAMLFLSGAALLYMVRGTLPVFLVAGLLAYAFEPLLQRLERRGYSRRGAVGVVFLGFLLFLACISALLAIAWQQAQTLLINYPNYQDKAIAIATHVRDRVNNLHLTPDMKASLKQAMSGLQGRAISSMGTWLQGATAWMVASVGSLLIFAIVMPIVTGWLMIEMNPIRARILMLIPPMYRRDVTEIAHSINEMLGRYVRGQMIICTLFGLLCTTAFYILSLVYGMSYPLVLGFIAAFLYIVPYVGMLTIASAAAMTGYFTSNAPVPCALIAVGCCILFNLVLDYGVTPRIVGKGVGLHPLMIIFALLSGVKIAGIIGMVIAIPLFASLRVVLIYLFPQLTAPIPDTSMESVTPSDDVDEAVISQAADAETSVTKPVPSS